MTDHRWGTVARSYIHTRLDRGVSPASQAEMVDAAGVGSVRSLDAAHLAMLSHPDDVAAAIVGLATTSR